ncbi:unnamed protein product [Closterium sp. Yama58-4]|nr:unnamed protein product [Closterium sp. Yama58-4]
MAGTHKWKEAMEMRMSLLGVQLEETRTELAATKGELEEAERRRVAEMREVKAHQDAVMQLRVEEAIGKSEGDEKKAWQVSAGCMHGRRLEESITVTLLSILERDKIEARCFLSILLTHAPQRIKLASQDASLSLSFFKGLSEAMLAHVSTMTHVKYIHLQSASGFTTEGIKHLYRLPQLEMLDLNSTDVADSALEGIGCMASLHDLDLKQTSVTDAGLLHLVDASSLKVLVLSGCKGVTSDGMVCVGRLTALEQLWLDGTAVADAGLPHLATLSSLKSLHMSGCKGVTDAGMVDVGKLTGLEELWLDGTAVTDAALAHLTALSSLKSLRLSECKGVTDAGMVDVGRLTALEELLLGGTAVTDAGLPHLTALSSLESLGLSGCKGVTKAGMADVGRLTRLKNLRLDGTAVTDDGLQQLTALTELISLGLPEGGLAFSVDLRKRIGM